MLKQFKRILRGEGLTGKEIAEMLGMNYATYRSLTRKSSKIVPSFVKGFLVGYKLGKNK